MSRLAPTSDLDKIEAARLGFDPQVQPLVPLTTLPAIQQQLLTPEVVEQGLIQQVPWQIEPLFADEFVLDFAHYPQAKQAAVCIPVVSRVDGLYVLFTRRAGHLLHHPGQVCFPGGRIEPSDKTAIHAALRETHEEIGIASNYIQAISEEPIYITNSLYAMRPIVALVQPDFQLDKDPDEVAEVFEVPLAALMDPKNHRLHHLPQRARAGRYYFSIQWQQHFIWGATAVVVRNLYHHLRAATHAYSQLLTNDLGTKRINKP